jgi:hypothetical protein
MIFADRHECQERVVAMSHRILVRDIAPRCLTADAGARLLSRLAPPIDAGETVDLDFDGITIFASLFFNASIARLLEKHSPSSLTLLIKVHNISETGKKAYSRSFENAAYYFALKEDEKRTLVEKINDLSAE